MKAELTTNNLVPNFFIEAIEARNNYQPEPANMSIPISDELALENNGIPLYQEADLPYFFFDQRYEESDCTSCKQIIPLIRNCINRTIYSDSRCIEFDAQMAREATADFDFFY